MIKYSNFENAVTSDVSHFKDACPISHAINACSVHLSFFCNWFWHLGASWGWFNFDSLKFPNFFATWNRVLLNFIVICLPSINLSAFNFNRPGPLWLFSSESILHLSENIRFGLLYPYFLGAWLLKSAGRFSLFLSSRINFAKQVSLCQNPLIIIFLNNLMN